MPSRRAARAAGDRRRAGERGARTGPGAADRQALELGETADARAYDLYLRGNDYAGRGNTESALRSAIQLYQQAVGLDSTFARAWARLARVSLQIYWYHYDRTESRLA